MSNSVLKNVSLIETDAGIKLEVEFERGPTSSIILKPGVDRECDVALFLITMSNKIAKDLV